MSIVNAVPLLEAAGGDYQISRSVRLRSSATAYFNRTFASAGNQQKMTYSMWIKRGATGAKALASSGWSGGGGTQGGAFIQFSGDSIDIYEQTNNSNTWEVKTTAVYRDSSAWYHIVVAIDTTQATAANRVIVYVNGVQVTSYATASYPTQNLSTKFNATNQRLFAADDASNPYIPFDGYATETYFIDGQALTPSSFGETNTTTGVWQPKKYAGTYGTNGFYLNFSDNSSNTAATIGKDYSGNGNNWTPNNISVTSGVTYDSMLDVPTPYADGGNGRGNYAVLNPLLSAGGTTANGNLQITTASGAGHSRATVAMPSSGKWYCEFTAVSATTSTDYIFGIVGADTAEASYGYNQTPSYAYTAFGERVVNGSFTSSFYSSYTTGDVIGCAVDLDTNQLTWYKNGTAQTAISITNGSYFWIVSDASGTRQITAAFNAGQRPFAYTPPTGFKALNTQNLPDATLLKGNKYFDISLYTGNGSTQTITNNGSMQPDLVWVKKRSGVDNHEVQDSVRGAGKRLAANTTDAEANISAVSAFNSNGFSVGNYGTTNESGYTYVGWQWKESVSAGFDIVTYTSSVGTVAHNLGVAPSMIIMKPRNNTDQWTVGHKSLNGGVNPWNYGIPLNTTATTQTNSGFWNNTAPTSSVFSTGSWNSGFNMVAYLFAEVAGFSKFGSYTGNGSADGPFVYLGFRPKFIMVKRTDAVGHWIIDDSSRDVSNIVALELYPSLSNAESSDPSYDFLSNGFKIRVTSTNKNASGGTYIYAAFAENPFKNSLAR